MLFEEENQFESEEAPEESVPNFTPYSFWVVGQLFYIVGVREVGFGSEYAAITELTHAALTWNPAPVESEEEKPEIIPVISVGTNQ